MITSHVQAPTTLQDASLIVDWLTQAPARHAPILQDSVRVWDQPACHWLASALKSSPQFGHGHFLGATMRQICNQSIMREHRLANRPQAA